MNRHLYKMAIRARMRFPNASRMAKHAVVPVLRSVYRVLGKGAVVNPAPIFVFGHHKTGTSVIASLVSRASGGRLSQDVFNAWEWYPLGELYMGRMKLSAFLESTRYHFSADIIKEPDFIFLYPQLARHFPDARFVVTIRNPMETIRSILDRLGFPGDFDRMTDDMHRTLDRLPGWRMIFDPHQLAIEETHYVSILARRWRMAAEVWSQHSDKIVLVKYESFLEDRQAVIEELARNVGLQVVHDISSDVDRPYQPPGARRGRWLEVFGKRNISRIEAICGDLMARLGYPSSAK